MSKIKKPIILGVLFLLPVIFLLFLYPSTHNYNPLDIVKGDIQELTDFESIPDVNVQLENQITVLGFLGNNPNQEALIGLNLKELIYDKFQGFKKFQVVIIVTDKAEESTKLLKKELNQYKELKYWRFVFGTEEEINKIYNTLRVEEPLNANLASEEVFIIDKERNQRGRLDDREENEKEKNIPVYGMYSYNCIEVAELKNKMSEDMRILFTEYRQKRKGNFNSTTRRAEDLKNNEQE
jgi:cytochrome oxidase Cu insertion factor (SCO1/SenC/PrrC family)